MQPQVSYVNEILIFVIFAASLNLLLGNTGQVSVAHAALGAVGGYSLAYTFLNYGTPPWLGLIIAVAASGLVGVIVGLPALRLTTEWLILLTLAVQSIVITLATTSSSFGGTYGLQNVSGLTFFGVKLVQPTDFLPLFLILAVAVLFVIHRLAESPYGRVLRGIREDEVACRSLGKNVFAYKLTVFSVTAAMAGLAGALLVMQNELASPTLFGFDQSTAIVAMVILGGAGNMVGAVIGAAALVLLTPFIQNVLNFSADRAALWRLIVYGFVLVVVMLVRPQGLLPEGFSFRAVLRRRRTRHAADIVRDLPPAEEVAHSASAPPELLVANAEAPAHAGLSDAIEPHTTWSAAGHKDAVLSVVGLAKRFGGITAADALTIQLRPGTITALVGPNGAGKTTVFNLLTGSIRPDAGRIVLKGRDITGMRPDQVAALGMVRSFQDVRVFARLSAAENVMVAVPGQSGERVSKLFLRPRFVADRERRTRDAAVQWLSFVGMDALADYPAGSLAFGQQKLVALARILATESDVVLLDEPASGIDERWVDVMLALIERLPQQGRTVCIVEHNLQIVSRLADHIYFMELGRIAAEGTFDELTHEPRLAEAYFGLA